MLYAMQWRTQRYVVRCALVKPSLMTRKLWKQLQLDTTLSELSSPPPMKPPSSFTLQLRHTANLDATEVRRLHRLPVGASAADLLPPAGIGAYGLEQISIVLDYHRSRVDTTSDTNVDLSASTSLVQRSLNSAEAVELADAAFRSIIFPKPTKLSLGIWVPKTVKTCDLSTIAPTIWSPGYAAVRAALCLHAFLR